MGFQWRSSSSSTRNLDAISSLTGRTFPPPGWSLSPPDPPRMMRPVVKQQLRAKIILAPLVILSPRRQVKEKRVSSPADFVFGLLDLVFGLRGRIPGCTRRRWRPPGHLCLAPCRLRRQGLRLIVSVGQLVIRSPRHWVKLGYHPIIKGVCNNRASLRSIRLSSCRNRGVAHLLYIRTLNKNNKYSL